MLTEKDRRILEEEFLERAAIKEFCGKMPREQAEREARQEQIRNAQKIAIEAAKSKKGPAQSSMAFGKSD